MGKTKNKPVQANEDTVQLSNDEMEALKSDDADGVEASDSLPSEEGRHEASNSEMTTEDASGEAGEDAARSDVEEDGEEAAEDDDAYQAYLISEYHKYRIITLVLAVLGFSTVLASIGLSQAGVLPIKIFNLMMSVANLFIVMMLVVAFTRTRPFKKKVRSYDKYYVSITDPDAEDGVRIEERRLPDMDDFFLIFERSARTELIPETEEYRKLRKIWLGLFIVAGIALVVSVALYLLVPGASTASIIILLAAMVLVVVAFYFDRTRMRPIRTKWSRDNYGMSEFQVRDRMNKRAE